MASVVLINRSDRQCRINGVLEALQHRARSFGGSAIGGSGKFLTMQTDSHYGSG